jgi:transcriptional regulator with XRE-family HTH domain
MKNIGQQAKAFRLSKGWSYTRMAEEVTKHHSEKVSRQLITQLEAAGDRKPRYLRALALVMGTSTDALLAGVETFPNSGSSKASGGVESDRASYVVPPTTTAVWTLARNLTALQPEARERAGTLLTNLAKDPAGPWAEWLIVLLSGDSDQISGKNTIGGGLNLQQNDSVDLSTYPGLKNATEWRRGDNNGDGDNVKTPKKQGGNGA